MKLTIKQDDIEADLSVWSISDWKRKMGIHRYNYLFLLSQDVVQLSFEQF